MHKIKDDDERPTKSGIACSHRTATENTGTRDRQTRANVDPLTSTHKGDDKKKPEGRTREAAPANQTRRNRSKHAPDGGSYTGPARREGNQAAEREVQKHHDRTTQRARPKNERDDAENQKVPKDAFRCTKGEDQRVASNARVPHPT